MPNFSYFPASNLGYWNSESAVRIRANSALSMCLISPKGDLSMVKPFLNGQGLLYRGIKKNIKFWNTV